MRGRSRPSSSTTTGRPRRCGWLDVVIGRYANRINGVTDFVITKLDVLTGFDKLPICVAYEVDGVRHDEMPVNQSDFHHAKPVYEVLDGWSEDISGCRTFEELPANSGLGDRGRPGPARDHPAPRPPGLSPSSGGAQDVHPVRGAGQHDIEHPHPSG